MGKRIAVITGGATGIGMAIAEEFIRRDYFVIAADVNGEAGKDLVSFFGSEKIRFVKTDVSDEKSVKDFFETVSSEHKTLDVLVNNAGIIKDNLIWNMSTADFDEVTGVNLKGTWLMCREAALIMKKQNFGRIINISSRAWLGNRGQTNYSASKAGVVALTRVLALELGKYNVLVNAVAPGLIDTPLTQKLEPHVLEKLIAAQPTRTIGRPGHVAAAVAFLAAETTQFITGQTIYVDGGKSIGSNLT